VPKPHRAPVEIEAKLLVTRESDFRAVARLESVGPYRLRHRDAVRLYSVYLDTPELALAHRGVALRLRRHAGRWELTAKWGGRVVGLVHERPELTVALSRAPRFPFHVDHKLPPQLDRLVAGRALEPILITQIHRRRIDVLAGGEEGEAPVAELALDRVRLRAPGGREPVARYCEIEIEHLRGSRRHVSRLAEFLQERFSLAASTESKFARGVTALYGADFAAARRRAGA
jgi:triphosphatase